MKIKVLGAGCQKCDLTKTRVEEAVKEMGVTADIQKITDILEIAKYGVLSTPAIVVDGEVKCTGKLPSKQEVKKWITGE